MRTSDGGEVGEGDEVEDEEIENETKVMGIEGRERERAEEAEGGDTCKCSL